MSLEVFSVVFLWLMCSTAWADETEILFDAEANASRPNVMFLLDNSGSMNQEVGSSGVSRMESLQGAMRDIMASVKDDVNVGLIRYGGLDDDDAHGVSFPATAVSENAEDLISSVVAIDNLPDPASDMPVRDFLVQISDSWVADGYTPIVDALYETALYFRGDVSEFGAYVPSHKQAAHPSSYEGGLTLDSCVDEHISSCAMDWGWCDGKNVVAGSCRTETWEDTRTWKNCLDIEEVTQVKEKCCGPLDEAGNASCSQKCPYTSTYDRCNLWKKADVNVCNYTYCSSAWEGELTYKSPIVDKCQANYIVLMSDGYPEHDGWGYDSGIDEKPDAVSLIEAMTGEGCESKPSGFTSGQCGAELTHYLSSADQMDAVEGEQLVETFAVAFGVSDRNALAYLQSLVTVEDGFFITNDAEQLVTAFNSVLDKISSKGSSFSSPAYSVNSRQPLGHSNDVYMPLFRNRNTPRWVGNIRKFKLVDGKIVDQNGQVAVDEDGVLKDTVQDFWSEEPTGADVAKGGAASQLPDPDERVLYTDAGIEKGKPGLLNKENARLKRELFTSTYTTRHGLLDFLPRDGRSCLGWYIDCDGVEHKVWPWKCVDIEEVTTCEGTPVTTAYRDELIRFVRGTDPEDGTPRSAMGDMLNSKPQLVEYDSGALLLFGTNEGFLHALDVDTGVEQWAFMPESLLKNIDNFYRNEEVGKHIYGIDGSFTIWKPDTNDDGKPDKTYAFFGLRRGGRAYYGFDLTRKNDPRLLWRITPDDTGFSRLGEAWSKPTLAKMRTQSGDDGLRDVLVWGAGYDARKDIEAKSSREADQMGTDVYIVDALTGQLLWSLNGGDRLSDGGAVAGATRLRHSVPGDIRVLDMDRNGSLDRLYFADTGGNVWRVDMGDVFDSGSANAYNYSKARLTHFAELGGHGTDNRKFFYEPDVALMTQNGKPVMTVALGSGYRTHPLNENTDDRFYVMRDPHVYEPMPADFETLTDSSLVNVDSLSESFITSDKKGWYYNLPEPHEKVLAPALTYLNKVVFTSFAKDGGGAGAGGVNDQCEASKNASRAYVLDLFTGKAVADLRRDGGNDRSVIVGYNELLDAPQVIFGQPASASGGSCKQGDCVQTTEIRIGKASLPILDEVNARGGSTAESMNLDMMPRLFWLDADATTYQ